VLSRLFTVGYGTFKVGGSARAKLQMGPYFGQNHRKQPTHRLPSSKPAETPHASVCMGVIVMGAITYH
jgi:hypothetical protein